MCLDQYSDDRKGTQIKARKVECGRVRDLFTDPVL